MRTFRLDSTMWLPRRLDEVFAFFADARNLETLTPPWLHFRILTPTPIEMRVGARIDYRLRIRGLPLRWQSEITAWDPPHRFLDEQRRGPYRLWVHEHTFAERDGGTEVRDRVTYAVPGGWLVERLLVGPDVRRIFAYRQETLARLFPADPRSGA
ncbi:MAG: SRPBCC family protein [Chloroflexi bacterium]|jgi:ligand-binding SRPBCC domain-containing protein|nr:SRPBCC family protein [Thermoleophilia bacterium]MCU0482898.1 SRPBCC family protein [Chloroflexota bacterium]